MLRRNAVYQCVEYGLGTQQVYYQADWNIYL